MRGQRKNPRKAVQPFENKKRKIDIFKNYEANGVEKIQRKLEIFSTLISKKSNETYPKQVKVNKNRNIFRKDRKKPVLLFFLFPKSPTPAMSAWRRRILKKNRFSPIALLMRKEGLRFQAWKDLRGTAERVRKTKSETLFYYRPRRTPWQIYTGHSTCSDLFRKVYQKRKLTANFLSLVPAWYALL